jgi:hypothetical protein
LHDWPLTFIVHPNFGIHCIAVSSHAYAKGICVFVLRVLQYL